MCIPGFRFVSGHAKDAQLAESSLTILVLSRYVLLK